jgi:hypothetical protein
VGAAVLAAGLSSTAVAAAAPVGAFTTRGAWTFVSAPQLHPPKLSTDVRRARTRLAHGDFLLDNFPNVGASGPMTGQGGPLMVNNALVPVWFHSVGTRVLSADLKQDSYLGKPVLTWWEGLFTGTGTVTRGQLMVVDQHYRRIATLKAASPWIISLHDAVISGPNVWVTAYRFVPHQDLRAYGGKRDGTLYDAGVQEYELRTGRLLYTWDALNNVPLSDSEQPASAKTASFGAWDAYHLNSVQALAGNQILVSMRNTWAAYLVDTTTNRVVWRLGGKRSTFTSASNARFAWQHDVQMLPSGNVSLYDDNCCKIQANGRLARPNGPSRGMVLRLDLAGRTASLAASFSRAPTRREAAFLGSFQLLPNSNGLLGWGSLPFFSEYSRSGRLLLDAVWPHKDQSYRALFTSTWVGTPFYPPTGAARTTRGRTTVYASWNGATQLAAWQVLAGPNAAHLRPVARRSKAGFETAIALRGSFNAFRVRALDARQRVIGTSAAFR